MTQRQLQRWQPLWVLVLSAFFAVGCQDSDQDVLTQPADVRPESANGQPSRDNASSLETTSKPEPETSPDTLHRKEIVGTWEDEYQGKRTLTVRADGTATMVVELEGVAATLYAKKLTFDEEWEIQDGVLIQKLLGGKPEGRVKLIMSTMGDSSRQEILELTAERMHLRDLKSDGTIEYDWQRVGNDDESPAE